MWFFTHSIVQGATSPAIFHCPACGERNVSGLAWTERQLTRLFGMITVVEERLHWVYGPCCERTLLSRMAPELLSELGADEIEAERLLADRVSPVKLALLMGAFLFCIVPVVGPTFLLLAWFPSGSSRPWFRTACRLCLGLHLVAMNLIVAMVMLADK